MNSVQSSEPISHELGIQLVTGANFGCVLHHFSGRTRFKGSQGQVRPEIRQKTENKNLNSYSRGPLKGPRGPLKGPRVSFKGPRGPFKGPRGPLKGPRAPSKGPRGPLKRPRGPFKGLRGIEGCPGDALQHLQLWYGALAQSPSRGSSKIVSSWCTLHFVCTCFAVSASPLDNVRPKKSLT